MTTSPLSRHPQALRVGSYASAAPPGMVEYAYYALLLYSMLAPGLGILVPMLASGMLLVLAMFCVIRLGARAIAVYAPLRLPLAFATAYLSVQMIVYGASILDGRDIIAWILGFIIVQSLCLRRGFLHRCTLVLFVMGLTALPYLTFIKSSVAEGRARVATDSMVTGDFISVNGLGAWFGFCCLYFTIVGIETRRVGVRVVSSLAAVGCLYITGLTVSRGALLATAIGITVAFRGLLRRGFVPLLVFITVSGTMYNFGVFDRIISDYSTRGMEDTGRLSVWPLALERFLNSPLLGVGMSNVATYVPFKQKRYIPHNSFLFVALASGVLPLAFFVAWWIRTAHNAFWSGEQSAAGAFRLPFLVYTFVNTWVGDFTFMAPWGILTFAIAMASSTPYTVRRLVVRRVQTLHGST